MKLLRPEQATASVPGNHQAGMAALAQLRTAVPLLRTEGVDPGDRSRGDEETSRTEASGTEAGTSGSGDKCSRRRPCARARGARYDASTGD